MAFGFRQVARSESGFSGIEIVLDIKLAVHNNPGLTTVRQPLQEMGEIAARALLNRIEEPADWVPDIAIEPEFVVRNSTAKALALPVVVCQGSRGSRLNTITGH